MMTVSRRAMMVHAARVLGVCVLVDRLTTIFLRKQFLDFPRIGFDTNGEFQVFFGNGVPELRFIVSI